MRQEALAELKRHLLLNYGTDWNTPKEYWEAAVEMTERALIAEQKLKEKEAA